MQYYSIADLEKLSGIKAHTIRIWEQRYQAFQPERTPGNTRLYNDDQLRKLLNVVSLSESGRKISELFSLSDAEINKLLQVAIDSTKSEDTQFEYFISQMVLAGLNYDEAGFEKHFSASLVRYGMKNTYVNIIYPMLVRVGLFWGKDEMRPAQEHFLSNLVRQKLHAAIDGLPLPAHGRRKWLLFLPEGESHEIGLLFGNYLIRAAGQSTIYLGSDVPFYALKDAIEKNQATDLLLFFVKNHAASARTSYLHNLLSVSGHCKIYLAGNKKQIENLEQANRIHAIQSVEELEKLLHG